MKNLKIILTLLLLTLFCDQDGYAQEVEQKEKEKVVFKTTKAETPKKVKESLMDYSNYKISDEVTYMRKEDTKVYKFKVEKGSWSHYLLINETGKIIGIETGEH